VQGETDERRRDKKKKRKKKSKLGYYLYAIVILLLTITNITLATLLLTHVQSIKVSGATYSQQSEIVSWIKEDPLTVNSLYTLVKFKTGSYKLPVYLEKVSVKLSAPWSLKVKVTEKPIIGCLVSDNSYVYFDEEGLVLQKTTEYSKEVPLIEGLKIDNAKKYEKLQVENEKVFQCLVSVTKEIEKHELTPDRVVWGESGMSLHFEKVCVQLGKSNFGIKILQLTALMDELEGKDGTLHLEHYTSDSNNISFEKNY
jgi:cell division protein FtsQ